MSDLSSRRQASIKESVRGLGRSLFRTPTYTDYQKRNLRWKYYYPTLHKIKFVKEFPAALKWKAGYFVYRKTSQFNRLLWIGSIQACRWVETNIQDRLRALKERSYSRIGLEDLYQDDFGDISVKIPLKWDSGAREVELVPRESVKKWNGVRFLAFKPGKGHKSGIVK